MNLQTLALHSALPNKDIWSSLRAPLYDSVAFEFEDCSKLAKAFQGQIPAHSYSRISNPTVEQFEQRVRSLCGGAVTATASGMAAITAVLVSLARNKSNIVVSGSLFANTLSLVQDTFRQWGLEVRLVNMLDEREVENAIDENSAFLFFESISNPQLEIPDYERLVQIARKKGVPTVMDGTLTFPSLLTGKKAGIDFEVVSSTKWISGGATCVGGLVVDYGTFNLANRDEFRNYTKKAGPMAFTLRLRREVHRNLGACLAPHNAWLQTLGLETLFLRAQKSSNNALELALFFKQTSETQDVRYPGLKDDPSYLSAQKYFSGSFGTLLCLDLGSRERAWKFADSLKIFRRATNLADNKSLIIHPASTIFSDYSEEERKQVKISEGLLRFSIGIEDIEDLKQDLQEGIKQL